MIYKLIIFLTILLLLAFALADLGYACHMLGIKILMGLILLLAITSVIKQAN